MLVDFKLGPYEEIRGVLVEAENHGDKLTVVIRIKRDVTLDIYQGELQGTLPKLGGRLGLLRVDRGYRVLRQERRLLACVGEGEGAADGETQDGT